MQKYFGPEGLLSRKIGGFESRDGQLQMAEEIHTLLSVERVNHESAESPVLLIEAETGIGKTLAYLVPSILSRKKVVVSTATINLQDQILKKEIPLLEEILDEKLDAVCIKGRQNYLCHYRWFQYRSSQQSSLLGDEECDDIDNWLLTTESGDRAELAWLPDNSSLWPKISAQSNQCLGGECPESSLCFMNRLRKKAGSSSLLIVNHHLFFSDLALRKAGYGEVLPRYEAVIFDEAHHLENVATNFFGKNFSQYQILDLVSDVERQAEADLPPSLGDKIVSQVRGLRERVDHFISIFPLQKGRFPLLPFIEAHSAWHSDIKHLSIGLERMIDELEGCFNYGEGWRSLHRRADDLHNNLVEIGLPDLIMENGSHVHWYERRERSVSLSATPVSVADELKKTLYSSVGCCIMTSATLTTAGKFSYVCERLGLEDNVKTMKLTSPFDYSKRTCLYIVENSFPLPNEERFSRKLNERIYDILKISQGRGLVLCTSFRAMESVAEYLHKLLPYPVLVQGNSSRDSLLRQFREITDSVLVAVASFWEGVDVPGEPLSCVIIDKLPFEVPSDPVLQARISDITAKGGKPFFDFQIPRAVLTLRQGVGRLMRSANDSGTIAIMDGRIFKKGYGKTFLSSMPPSPVVRTLEEVEQFFKQQEEHG